MSLKRISVILGGGARRPRFARHASAPRAFPNPIMTVHICENGTKTDDTKKWQKPCDRVLRNTLPSALQQPRIFFISGLVRVPTKPIERYIMWSNASIAFLFERETGVNNLSCMPLALDSTTWITRASTRPHVMISCRQWFLGGRLGFEKARWELSLKDIFTMDVTKLAFRRSLVAN